MNAQPCGISSFPQLHHSVLPTPVHELPWLSKEFGVHVFCKRDDLSGFGFGGNKSRKLDFLIADAKERGCDTLVTVGANQSNFCRIVSAYGSANDMKVHLVLGGAKPDIPTGNLRLDHLLDATCHHVESSSWDDWNKVAGQLEKTLTGQGHTCYRMPVGGSTPTGALGYAQAVSELIEDEKRLGLHFDALFMATSSAGTQAGLLAGKFITDWPTEIIGISTAKPAEQQQADVFELLKRTLSLLNQPMDKQRARDMIHVDDHFLGPGYGARTPECEEAILLFARKCGIFVDYVYTGKAAAGMLACLRTGQFTSGSNILFLHSGGNLELFE